jgi:hypothetical protein
VSHEFFGFPGHKKVMFIPYCSLLSAQIMPKNVHILIYQYIIAKKSQQSLESFMNPDLFAGGGPCLHLGDCQLVRVVVAEGRMAVAIF